MKLVNLTIAILVYVCSTKAQMINSSNEQPAFDYLFPAKSSSTITVGSGLPYVGIGEYAYGVSDRFSAGLLIGATPKVMGYGFRLRAVLYENGDQNFRMTFRVPTFYYPQTKDLGGEPWWLTFPVVATEWKFASGVRLSADAGVLATVCAESLSHSLFGTGHHEEMEEMGFEGSTMYSIGGGVAIPLSYSVVLQSNLDFIFDKGGLADRSTAVETPFVWTVGLSFGL